MAFHPPSGGGTSDITINSTPIIGGADTQVLFNDGGFVGSDAGFTYNKTTDRLTLLGGLTVTQTATASGTAPTGITITPGNHTATTASTEVLYGQFGTTGMTLQLATGALTTQRFWLFQAPTISAVGATTITNTATLTVSGAPVAGTNVTLGAKFSIWAQAGLARFDGGITTGVASALSEQFGNAAVANNFSTAIGAAANASGGGVGGSLAVGATASASGERSMAFGIGANATLAGQITFAVADAAISPTMFVGNGVTNAAPTSWTLNASGGSGTDIGGGNISIAGGRGTGSGLGGTISFQSTLAGASGTTARSLYTMATFTNTGNFCLGVTTAGSSAAGVLCLSNTATSPTNSTDRVQMNAKDISAGNATLELWTETALVTETVVSDRTLTIFHNGTQIKVCCKS